MAGAAPVTVYRDEMVLGFGQRQSLLKDSTTPQTQINGSSAVFMVVSSAGTATTRGVNGMIPAQDNSNTQVTCTLAEKHDLRRMTGFNVFQSQGNQREIMQINAMSVLNRDIDSVILTALSAATLTTGTAAKATFSLVMKAMAALQTSGVPWDGQVFAVISPAFLGYLMSIPQFANADWVTVKPAVSFPGWDAAAQNKAGQGWYDWMGVKWIVSNQIAGIGTSSETCYMYHRWAIGHAANSEGMKVAAGYNDEQDYSYARCSLYHGAKLLQNTGVAKMVHDGSEFVTS